MKRVANDYLTVTDAVLGDKEICLLSVPIVPVFRS